MDNELKRTLFLMSYVPGKDLKVIKESTDILAESRQTEMQAFGLFRQKGKGDDISKWAIEQFRTVDETRNKLLTLPMTILFLKSGTMPEILKTFKIVSDLVNNDKIPLPVAENNVVRVGKKTFSNIDTFTEYITDINTMTKEYREWKNTFTIDVDAEPIFPRNKAEEKSNIVIYDANDVGRCIKYGMGGITGKYYQFCISKPGNTNWQSYRDQKGSTFYFVFDKNRDLSDPLHLTVVDHTVGKGMYDVNGGFEITDVNNSTNNISEFGDNILGYIEYLRNRGVPVEEIFINRPKTEEEKDEQSRLGTKNTDLIWFKNLSFNEKTKYIGRGHELSDEQFKYLWGYRKISAGYQLLKQYLNLGISLPPNQFNLLTSESD